MAAPQYVPVAPLERTRSYTSPDAVPDRWRAERPGDLASLQPSGGLMGHQGPDQGYVLRLLRQFGDKLHLASGEHRDDVDRGCAQIALKRASLFGRAPVVYDLEVAYRVWGFLDADAAHELVTARRSRFEGVAERHHYANARNLVACVPDEVLRMSPADVEARYHAAWEDLVTLS